MARCLQSFTRTYNFLRKPMVRKEAPMVVDPVCKKEVDEKSALGGKARFWGKVFFFCDKKCRATFQRDPQKFVSKEDAEKEPGYDPRLFIGDIKNRAK